MSAKYKVGDRVRLKMEKEYILSPLSLETIKELPNKVVTVERVLSPGEIALLVGRVKSDYYYNFKEIFWAWAEEFIECTEKEYLRKEAEEEEEEYRNRQVVSRYELMDFED
jgi:hypothetical protein